MDIDSSKVMPESVYHQLLQDAGREVDASHKLKLILGRDDDAKLVEAILASKPQNRLPDLEQLKINRIQNVEDANVRDFLAECAPVNIKRFGFQKEGRDFLPFEFYGDALLSVLPRVTDKVAIGFTIFSAHEFEQVIQKCSNVHTLKFIAFRVDSDTELNFGDAQYAIKKLVFDGNHPGEDFKDWREDPSKFANIVKAISASSLSQSLEQIVLDECGIKVDEARQICEENGLGHVKCTDIFGN